MNIEELATQIANKINNFIPLNERLWRVKDIAEYLHKSKATVHSTIICKPDFPKAIRINGHPLYEAHEVITWVKRHKR